MKSQRRLPSFASSTLRSRLRVIAVLVIGFSIPTVNALAGGLDGGNATGTGAVAVGPSSSASDFGATASGTNSTASGGQSTASGTYSTASGYLSSATGAFSTASGYESTTSGYLLSLIHI